jgi:hypothetical protein
MEAGELELLGMLGGQLGLGDSAARVMTRCVSIGNASSARKTRTP